MIGLEKKRLHQEKKDDFERQFRLGLVHRHGYTHQDHKYIEYNE